MLVAYQGSKTILSASLHPDKRGLLISSDVIKSKAIHPRYL